MGLFFFCANIIEIINVGVPPLYEEVLGSELIVGARDLPVDGFLVCLIKKITGSRAKKGEPLQLEQAAGGELDQ